MKAFSHVSIVNCFWMWAPSTNSLEEIIFKNNIPTPMCKKVMLQISKPLRTIAMKISSPELLILSLWCTTPPSLLALMTLVCMCPVDWWQLSNHTHWCCAQKKSQLRYVANAPLLWFRLILSINYGGVLSWSFWALKTIRWINQTSGILQGQVHAESRC